MADPLSRPGRQQGSRRTLPSYSIDVSESTSTTSGGQLPGTAGINFATGSVRLFGLENQPVNTTDTITRPTEPVNDNVYRVPEPLKFLAGAGEKLYNGVADIAGLPKVKETGTVVSDAVENFAAEVSKVPVVSNVVGMGGNIVGLAGKPVSMAAEGAAGALGLVGTALTPVMDFAYQKGVTEGRMEDARKVIDLTLGRNMTQRREYYNQIHGSPFPWNWNTPEAKLGWEDYLDWAKKSYDLIGTEKSPTLQDPISWAGGAGSLYQWMTKLSGMHNARDPRAYGLEYLSGDFTKMYLEGVPTEQILQHFRDNLLLTNTSPINAMVFSIANPVEWYAWDIPFKGIAAAGRVGPKLAGAYRAGKAEAIPFADALARAAMSKPSYAVLKHMKGVGLMWDMGERFTGAVGSRASGLANRMWAPTKFQAVVEEFGTNKNVTMSGSESGAAVVKSYYDMHASIAPEAADAFSDAFIRAVAYDVTGETIHELATEARITALSQSEQILQLAARGDVESLKTHPALVGQPTEIADTIVSTVKAYVKNPAGQKERDLIQDLWKKLVLARNQVEIGKNVGAMEVNSKRVKYLFKTFKNKIISNARIRLADSKSRYIPKISVHLESGAGANGELVEAMVRKHLAATGKIGDQQAAARIRLQIQSLWTDAQTRFNAAKASGNTKQLADIVEELSSHAEIARLAAYGRALQIVTDLRRLKGYSNINVISELSLTGSRLVKEIDAISVLLEKADEVAIKAKLKEVVHGYEQLRAQFDSAVVIDELIDETPIEMAKMVLDALRRIKDDSLFVSDASAQKAVLQTVLDGPNAVGPEPANAIGMWDAIPSSNSHPAFEGELDFDNVAKVLTKEDPATLLYQRPDYDLTPEKLVDHYGLKSSAYLSLYEQGGYDKVRKGYEMTHRGLFEIVALPSKSTPQNVGGLRPIAKADGGIGYMHDETVAIDNGTLQPESDVHMLFNKDTDKADIPIEEIGDFVSAQNHLDWFNGGTDETTFSQIGREFQIETDGWHISANKDGVEERYLVKTFTENPVGMHQLLIRNRINRHVAAAQAKDTIWAFPEIKVGTSNRLAVPNNYTDEGGPLSDYANMYAIQKDNYYNWNEGNEFSFADQSTVHFGAGWQYSSNPGGVWTTRAVWGTEKAIQDLNSASKLRLLLDSAGVAAKFLARAEEWVDGGAEFRGVLLHLNKDGELIKATQYLDPSNIVRGSGSQTITVDPARSFEDWLSNTYMESTVSGTSVKIKDIILSAVDEAGFTKYKELNPKIAANENFALFKFALMQAMADPGTRFIAEGWHKLPRRLTRSRMIETGVSLKNLKADHSKIFYGFSHSFADWLHAWDSVMVTRGEQGAMYGLKAPGETTLFDVIGEVEAYTAALWRRINEVTQGKNPAISYKPGKSASDITNIVNDIIPQNEYTPAYSIADYDFPQADDAVNLLERVNELINHPYLPDEDYSSLELMRSKLHDNAETFGTLADRSVVSIVDSIFPKQQVNMFGDEVSFPSVAFEGTNSLDSGLQLDISAAQLIKDNKLSIGDVGHLALNYHGIYDVTPRMYTERGTLLWAPKLVDVREIKGQKIISELDMNRHKNQYTYGMGIQMDADALRNRVTDIEWVRGDVMAAARAQQAAYEKLIEDPETVEAAHLYQSLKDLGYDIGKDPASGMVPEIRYVNSPITREVVPMAIPRPYIPPNKVMNMDDLGMGAKFSMSTEGANMNRAKRALMTWSNNEMYQNVAQRLWRGSAGKLTENDTYSIVANLFRRALLQDINPQGLSSKEVQEIFVSGMGGGEMGLRKYVKIFGPDTESPLPRTLLLYAAAGDLRKIGVAPHVSKSMQAKNPAMATWVNKMHPLARYKYSPYFNQQEAIEPIALLELNGIRGRAIQEEASLLTGLLSAPGTARWDTFETGAQVLRPKATILTDVENSNPDLSVWGQMRQNAVIGKIAKVLAPVGESARASIVNIKASGIQQMSYNNAKVRGGMQRVLNIAPEVQTWMRTQGLHNVDDAFKYMIDAGQALAMPSKIMPWSDKLSARWTTGTVMDLGPLKPVQEILERAESGAILGADELENVISAKLLAENTGATDDLQKNLVEAFSNFIKTIGTKQGDSIQTASGAWKGLDAMTTREGIDADVAAEIQRWTGTGNISINEYLAAKAEFGVQDTQLVRDVAKMEQAAKGGQSYNPALADPFSPMEDRVRRLDKAINSNRIVSSFPLYRGTDLALFMTKEQIANLKAGSEFGMENISAWSREANVARNRASGSEGAVLEIVHPVGIPGIDLLGGKSLSGYTGEAEVLLPRGLRWRVQSVGSFGSVRRLQISPILDRKYLASVKGLGAEPSAIQQLRQAVDNILVQSQTRYETAKTAYRLIETHPEIKRSLYEKAIAAGATFKKTYNPEDVVLRKPVDWTSTYTMKDPTTGRVSRSSVTFPDDPGEQYIDQTVLYGRKAPQNEQVSTGMNKGEFWYGTDGVKRMLKTVGSTAPNPLEQSLSAINEWVGRRVYAKLGHGGPKTSLGVDKDGKALLVSEFMSDVEFKSLDKWTEDEARKFVDGSLADLVLGSWDPLGKVETATSLVDNAAVDKLGRPVRIDFGSFGLYRAGGNRKVPENIASFSPGFWFREGSGGSRWPVAQLLSRAWPDSNMVKVKPQVITNHPHFIEMADSLIHTLDSAHPDGLRGFLRSLYYDGFKALDGKVSAPISESDVMKLADETADMIEGQLLTVRETVESQRAQLDAQIRAYQSWKESSGAKAKVPRVETTYTPDPTVEYLFERMAYHHANGTMIPVWEEALSMVSRGETLPPDMVRALAKYLPDFLLPRSRMEQLFQAGSLALMEGTKKAVVRQLYATEKTWLERSANHPYLGIYPLSYQLHKVLPEFFEALFVYAPFVGTYKPFWGAYKLQQINDHVAAALETAPELKEFVDSRPPLLLWLNGILPGFPTDVSVSWPYWMRGGILGPLAQGKPEDIPASVARSGLTSFSRTIGPSQSAQQIYNIMEDVSKFIFQPGGPFGDGASPTIQQWLWPWEQQSEYDRPE